MFAKSVSHLIDLGFKYKISQIYFTIYIIFLRNIAYIDSLNYFVSGTQT